MMALLRSFRFAFEGIAHAFRTQRNFQIHCGITFFIVALGAWLSLSALEWAVVVVMAALVFTLELMNTALEAIVDKTSPEIHPLAKVAKDCAAGAVLLGAIAAVVVGLLVLGPKLLQRVG